jgi:N12 class adenine-specific DNA methylase
LAPPGNGAKIAANLAALRTLRAVQDEDRPATAAEQRILARWASWGAVPEIFDPASTAYRPARAELAGLLDDRQLAAARRTTINAHYTSAEVVTALWSTVTALGFDPVDARVLEPGSGSGNFIGFAPEGTWLTGVELDPTTAAIAQALYPHAAIRAESFADTRLPAGSQDLVIGNVPFGSVVLHDRAHNPDQFSIHNHFIVKSLDLVRPGGLVAVVTSRFTLDAAASTARQVMADRADLVGAVRLPAGTFRAAAGTDVVTDVVVLRRRPTGTPPAGERWTATAAVATPDGPTEINEYFARHPEMIAGDVRVVHGQYSATDVNVTPNAAKPIRDAFDRLVTYGHAGQLTYSPPPEPRLPTSAARPAAPGAPVVLGGRARKEGSIVTVGPATFARVVNGELERFPTPKSTAAELRALTAIRDTVAELLDQQAASADNDTFAALQARLNLLYDGYVERYGPLGRFQLARTGRINPDSGEEILRRAYPAMAGFRRDPDFPAVLALETYDPETGTATKAAIFSHRVVGPRPRPTRADTPAEALAVSLDETGAVDLDRIGRLLDVDADQARRALGLLVWDDPCGGPPITAQRYLSGNVRAKLAEATTAAASDPRFEGNVAALTAVQPDDLTPVEIDARPGVTWIPATDIQTFIADTFAGQTAEVEHAAVTAAWAVRVPSWQRSTLLMTSTWGTKRADAIILLNASLNQQRHQVYDNHPDGTRTLNADETLLAQEKQQALSDRFAQWVWENPERSARLSTRYNTLFNSVVLPVWDGSHQTFPGLADTFRPRPHQIDAVWRAVQEPSVLLGHPVGAGKTAVMAMAAMELRRLGLVQKPALAVPNHMLEQFTTEFLQLYPQAKVLMASSEETRPDRRKEFVARCATGDWDAIIMTHSAFEKIPVSAATEAAYLENEVAEFRAALAESRDGKGLTVKALETAVIRKEERIKALRDDVRRDDGVTFEASGVDYLLVDEAHLFKNLSFPTRIQGVVGGQAKRATDLDLKLQYIRATHGDRAATFATATFVANSVAELWVMQHYLQPAVLRDAGVDRFDAWAATFGRTVANLELSPDGNSYRVKARFARFANVPELLAMFRAVADVKTVEQLGLPTPDLVGGRPEVVVVPSSPDLRLYVKTLAERAGNLGRGKEAAREDNMLKITGDGRKAALDLRLVDWPPDPDGGKISAAADRIAAIYHRHKDRPYPTTGPRPGALQLVFCDLSTPSPDWNAYHELKARLVERGLPPDSVRFVHDGANDRQKAELFAQARSGVTAVLVGSTAKMGVGTNVQARAIALHDLDAPWRPADLDQRHGRILRQGNLNDQVSIFRYVTEGSFDVFMYQTLERKSQFIHQVSRGDRDIARTVDDVGEQTLSLAEVKALATGNPLIMEKAGVDNDVAKLDRLAHAHGAEQRRAANTIVDGTERIGALRPKLADLERAVALRTVITDDAFAATIDGQRYTKRAEAADRLRAALVAARHRSGQTIPVGRLAGLDLVVRVEGTGGDATLDVAVAGVAVHPVRVDARDLRDLHAGGFITRVSNMIGGLDDRAEQLRNQIRATRSEIAQAEIINQKPFDQAAILAGLRLRQAEIDKALLELGDSHPDNIPPAAVADTTTDPSTGPPPPPRDEPHPAATMTTTALQQHIATAESTVAAKERALAGADQAIARLTRRLQDKPAARSNDPRTEALLRQHAERDRLTAAIAALAADLQKSRAELGARPDQTTPHVDPAASPVPELSPRTPTAPPGRRHPPHHQPPQVTASRPTQTRAGSGRSPQ